MKAKSSGVREQRGYIAEPPLAASIVVTAGLIDEAVKLFCPTVSPSAPEWAHGAAQMVLISILPIWQREKEPQKLPPPLPSVGSNLTDNPLFENDATPPPNSKTRTKSKGGRANVFHAPVWQRFQLAPPLWAISFRGKKSEEYRDGFGCGVIEGILGLLPPESSEGAFEIVNYQKQEAAQLSSDQSADFFNGRRDGEKSVRKMPERARSMVERSKCFMEIAKGWEELLKKKITNPPELHDWLCKKGLLCSHKDSKAEVRKICRLIGFGANGTVENTPEK